MEQTLGKRISTMRKKMKLTQDQLAEQLGVTAQAVSKWENDQSCPDIATLPRLAEIFRCSTDELLGIASARKVHEAEVVSEDEAEKDGLHISKDGFEFKLEHGGKRGAVGFAILVLAVGGLYLAAQLLSWDVSFWSILWPTSILVFGLFGSTPTFSFGGLGCILLGAYFLLDNLHVLPFELGWNLVLPVAMLLFGLSLLVKALRKPRKTAPVISINDSRADSRASFCQVDGETFTCECSFSGDRHHIALPRLAGGSVGADFCEVTVDLSGVEEVSEDCSIDVDVSFGNCILLVPGRYHVELSKDTSFGSVTLKGEPDPTPAGTIRINADISFGNITISYI